MPLQQALPASASRNGGHERWFRRCRVGAGRAAPGLLAGGRSIASRKIIGRSIAIAEAVDLAEHAAGGTTTILLQGETGTGKEIFAKAIHLMSPRADEQFVALNCAAIPDSLLESELFGYVRGAFTGATANKVGL